MLDSSVGSSEGVAMAMGQVRGQASTLQVEMVCLDELVAEDDRYRRLDRLVDWSFVREVAAPYYAQDVGRPSIDPIVLVKLMVAGALEGIGSTRELLRQASVRLDLRRFLGYGLAERLPVHQTLSHAHTRRFVDAALFERLFLRSLELCKRSNQNEFWSLLKQTRQQPRARKASWISARRS
jgi:transposase